MGAGNQGGGSGAEDSAIRNQFSKEKKTAKESRDYFRDRDAGKFAGSTFYKDDGSVNTTPSYFEDMSIADVLSPEMYDPTKVNANITFGERNKKGSGYNNLSQRDIAQVRSRFNKYGPGSANAMQGDINTSPFDLVDFAEDGTVQGMGPNRFMDERGTGQLVFDPGAGLKGLPSFTDQGASNPQYDRSRESMVGQGLQGLTEYIGGGGMMGALSNAIGGGNTAETTTAPETIDLNPADGSTTENNGIMNSIYKGINYARDNPVPTDLPQYAGGYTGSGANNPFLSSAQRDKPNAFINPAPQFNAQGAQVPFDGGNRIDVPLGIGTLPGKKTLSELAETEPVITAGFSGFRNPTNVFDPLQRIIDDAKRPLGDRVSMYEDDPSIAFGFGGEPFDLSEGSVDLSETSGKAQLPTPFGNSLGVPVEELGSSLREASLGGADQFYSPYTFNPIGDRALEKDFPPYSSMENELANSTMRFKPQMKAPFGNKLGVSVEEMNYSPREDSLGGADQVIPPYGSLFADQRTADAASDFASGEGGTGAQISETPAYSDDADQLEDLRTTAAVQAPLNQPYGSLFADQRAAKAARDFYMGEGGMGAQLSETPAFDPSVPYSPNPIIARADEKNYSADLTPGIRQAAIDRNARVNAAAQRGILIDQLERADVERSAFPNAPSTVSDGMTQAANREASLGGADAGPMSIGDAFKNIGGDLKRIFNEDPAVVARREAAERDENMYGTGMFDLSETYDPSGANNMNMTDDNVNMTDAFKYIGGDIRDIFKESYNNAQTGVNESIPERIPYGGLSLEGFSEFDTLSPSSVSASQNGFNPANIGEPAENTIAKVIADARTDRLAKLGTATGFENNMPLEQEGPLVERDSRIRDAMAPDGLDDNMYNDGSEIFDLSETYNPSGGGFTDGGGGGGGSGGCPEGYEPMTLANGETVCVPIEEEVTEEEVEEETPVTPTVRPAMGPSAYTPQAVSPIRPYTLQPGEQGVGGLADILQLQNYPNIV